jgi:DNA-binding transcriptional ArsR family regulator
MNAFYKHHHDSIRFGYRCFDRILLNGVIQPFQQPERVIGFFNTYRDHQRVSRDTLRDIANQFHGWVKNRAQTWHVPILDAPDGRRDDFVEPFFRRAKPDEVVLILKGREPARILIAIGNKQDDRWHLQFAQRWVIQYNFYVNDRQWGRMFVRLCPYFPFSARVYLNQHHWLAQHLRTERIDFQQCANAILKCRAPERLQELADSLTARDLTTCGEKWLARFTPFFTARERTDAGCRHRLFFAQVEYCDNLVCQRRAALDELGERLLDANRTIGQPHKLTVIFGRRVTRRYRGQLQTVIEDLHLPNPVIRSHYGHGFIKQYVRDHGLLRTEATTNNVRDYGVPKAIEHLPQLRQKQAAILDNYLDVQQDILETFLDRGPLQKLGQPTLLPSGKRLPGLRLDHPRQLAVMHALVRFSHIAAGGIFRMADLHAHVVQALGRSTSDYPLSSLRYDLSKLRAKGLVEKLPRSRQYRLRADGYRLCLVFLKLFERVYAPLTAGLLRPVRTDAQVPSEKLSQLDRLYHHVSEALDRLVSAVGLQAA